MEKADEMELCLTQRPNSLICFIKTLEVDSILKLLINILGQGEHRL